MAEEPGPSNISSNTRNSSGKFVGSGQKRIIINMYKDLKSNRPNLKYKEIIKELSRQSGIGQLTIMRSISEYKRTGKVTSPNRRKLRPTTFEKLPEEAKNKIRRTVQDFWLRGEVPNVKKVLRVVNGNSELPDFSQATLYRILKELNFKCTSTNRSSTLLEQQHIAAWRQNFLKMMEKYRNEGRPIYYLDETWISVGSTNSPTNSGTGLIVGHIGCEEGFVAGGLLCLDTRKGSADYHDEMNGRTFFDWFQRILPLLKDGAVIVMDSAACHSVKVETYPTMSWIKQDIIRWLISKKQKIDPGARKAALIDLVLDIQPRRDTYLVEEFAKADDKIVLRLPPYHSELNPMELAWVMVKDYIKTNNTTHKLADVKQLLFEAIKKIAAESWQNFIRHVKAEEERLDNLDAITDDIMDSPDVNESDGSDPDSEPMSISDIE